MSHNKPLNPIADFMAKHNMTESEVLAAIEQIRSDVEVLKYGHNPKVDAALFQNDSLIEKAMIDDGFISRNLIIKPVSEESKDAPASLCKRYAELAELINDCHHARKYIDQIDSSIFTISQITGKDAEKHIDALRDLAGFLNTVAFEAKTEIKQINLKLKRMP